MLDSAGFATTAETVNVCGSVGISVNQHRHEPLFAVARILLDLIIRCQRHDVNS